jgi:hypothetical protein
MKNDYLKSKMGANRKRRESFLSAGVNPLLLKKF